MPLDFDERLADVIDALDRSWFDTVERARLPDGKRIVAKRRRTARGVRLFVHLFGPARQNNRIGKDTGRLQFLARLFFALSETVDGEDYGLPSSATFEQRLQQMHQTWHSMSEGTKGAWTIFAGRMYGRLLTIR